MPSNKRQKHSNINKDTTTAFKGGKSCRSSKSSKSNKVSAPVWHILNDDTQHEYVKCCRLLYNTYKPEYLDELSSIDEIKSDDDIYSKVATIFDTYDQHLIGFKLFLVIARVTVLTDEGYSVFKQKMTGFGTANPLYNHHRSCFIFILANIYREQLVQQRNTDNACAVYPKDIVQAENKCNLDSLVITYYSNNDIMCGNDKTQAYNIYNSLYSEHHRKLAETVSSEHLETFTKLYIIYDIPEPEPSKKRKAAKLEPKTSSRGTRSSHSAYNQLNRLYQVVTGVKHDTAAYARFLDSFTIHEMRYLAQFAEQFIVPFPIHTVNPSVVELMRSGLASLSRPIDVDTVHPENIGGITPRQCYKHLDINACNNMLKSIFRQVQTIRNDHPEYSRDTWSPIVQTMTESASTFIGQISREVQAETPGEPAEELGSAINSDSEDNEPESVENNPDTENLGQGSSSSSSNTSRFDLEDDMD